MERTRKKNNERFLQDVTQEYQNKLFSENSVFSFILCYTRDDI